MTGNQSENDWKAILQKLAAIREQDEYSASDVDFIREQLQSYDDRIRGGAALAASGCVFEPNILDLLTDMVQSGEADAIRKASIQTLGEVIYEGVMRSFEDEIGASTQMEYAEEWDEVQTESLHEDYLRVKNLLLSIIQDEFEIPEVRETCLVSLSDLGFLLPVQEIIHDFIESEDPSSRLVALHVMGKYPQFWLEELENFLDARLPKAVLLEAISSSYSSNSGRLARKIEKLLTSNDPDILTYSLLTLTNINKTEHLGEILQKFTGSEYEQVRKTAHDSLLTLSQKNFSDFMQKELGIDE
jgi:HEAT repeat protein